MPVQLFHISNRVFFETLKPLGHMLTLSLSLSAVFFEAFSVVVAAWEPLLHLVQKLSFIPLSLKFGPIQLEDNFSWFLLSTTSTLPSEGFT